MMQNKLERYDQPTDSALVYVNEYRLPILPLTHNGKKGSIPLFNRLLARSCGHDSTNNHNAYKVGKAKSSLLEIK
jgi:hypothetical protein